jgi:hypothetical protein
MDISLLITNLWVEPNRSRPAREGVVMPEVLLAVHGQLAESFQP